MEKILAIDLGKFKSAVCILTKPEKNPAFRTVKTVHQDFHDFRYSIICCCSLLIQPASIISSIVMGLIFI
jgi:hypothetical protein